MAPTAENYQLKWHSFSSYLHSCVSSYISEQAFADVSLCTLDGYNIMAHRFILSACSQYLNQIFKMQPKIVSSLPFVIVLPPEINHKTLKTLVQYMYSGETTVSNDILENVLRGGDILKIKGLWRPKEDRLDKKLVKVHQKISDAQKKPIDEERGKETKNQSTHIKPAEQKISSMNKNETISDKNGTNEMREEIVTNEPQENNMILNENEGEINENLQYLMIKEEPVEWNENEADMELMDEKEIFQTEMTIKPEILLDTSNEQNEELYSPLTCELCTETFTHPANWVKHIQTHTDMLPAKRQRNGRQSVDDDATFPPLHCDMCQKHFSTPAEWVHHIQNTHTEFELRLYNKTTSKPARVNKQTTAAHKICLICNKTFPSHASMLIHRRTHTGEKPYMCKYCSKGFNVKSNLLRHLRTLHDKIINSTEIESKEDIIYKLKNR